jgi:hypothetical protein
MSGNEMEAHLGVAMAAMDSAKVRLLSLFDLTYPHMLDDQERKTWTAGLFLAQNSLTQARNELNRAIGGSDAQTTTGRLRALLRSTGPTGEPNQ